MTADVELLPCGECGMPCLPGEYHPYAACLLFRACRNSDTVRGNLQDAQDHFTAAQAAEIEALLAEREVIGAEAVKYAGKSGRLEARAERLAEALRDIESRPWNGVRPIQIAARAALHPTAAQEEGK